MLVVHHLSKSFGITPVLSDINFAINPGEKIALVGPNGCGKTTLLRILAGEDAADSGSFQFNPPDLSVGYLPQGGSFNADETFADYIRRAEGDLPGLSLQLEPLAEALMRSPQNAALQRQYDAVLAQIEERSSSAASAPAVLASLGLDNLPGDLPLSALSGGQKTRLGLAGILLANPRLLLLDEPTNHLDFEMLDWLETWLLHSRCAVLVVSHDRAFLDNVAQTILELEPATHSLKAYVGNYSDYLDQKEAERARHWQEYSDQQTQIRELTKAARQVRGLATFKKGGKADTGDKFAKAFFANRSLATVKRAKNIEARVEKLLIEDHIEKPHSTWQMKMDFTSAPESGRDVLILENLSIGYGQTVILSGLNAVLRYGERSALVGLNGCGKTTLLRTAAGILPVLAGRCRLGANVIPGYITQEQEELTPEFNALTTFQRSASLNETESRAFLHKFLFSGDEVFTPVGSLSYGQRSRLALACLVARGCNFLLLDEPLNHLDLPSRAQFEQALADFEGTILTVVHDRYFIQRYATRLWQIENGKLIEQEQ
jgi:ATPase subunit of ABC transporter with duplicated ATPase domains